MTDEELVAIMTAYGRAWETKDAAGLLALFAPDATYQVSPFSQPLQGHAAIEAYWANLRKRHVQFQLGPCKAIGDTGYAEWVSRFTYRASSDGRDMRGIIILTVVGGRITALREYWQSRSWRFLEEAPPEAKRRRCHSPSEPATKTPKPAGGPTDPVPACAEASIASATSSNGSPAAPALRVPYARRKQKGKRLLTGTRPPPAQPPP
eukprot:EG_transcript_22827